MIDALKTRKLWYELHTFAKEIKVSSAQLSFVENWLQRAHATLGCPSCWWKVRNFCRAWPVSYGDDLYLWSICLHDYVNKEMGKALFYPELTLAPLRLRGIIQ